MRGLRIVAAVAAAVIVIVGAGAAPAGASRDGWDPRLAEVAHAVEELRGLDFDHPVPVKQLSNREFEQQVTGGKITAADRREWSWSSEALTAFGFMSHPIPLKALKDETGGFYGGYYDPDEEAIVVRHEKLTTPSMRALLAHELTHALQDQHFSLDNVHKRSRHSDVPRALVEGDADNVATLYIDKKLTEGEREELYSTNDSGDSSGNDGEARLPVFFELQRTEPYRLGSRMVWVLEATGKQRAIDAALRKPPVDDAAFLDPRALLDPQRIRTVRPPEINSTTEIAHGGPHVLAPDLLYFMLAERMAPSAALRAAERWGGGRYVVFQSQATRCVRAAIVGRDGPADAAVIADALRAWSAGHRETFPVQVAGSTVRFTTCVPTDTVAAPPDAALVQAFEHVALRFDITETGLRQGMSVPEAICTADDLLARPNVVGPLSTITSTHTPYPSELVDTLRAALDPLVTPPACN